MKLSINNIRFACSLLLAFACCQPGTSATVTGTRCTLGNSTMASGVNACSLGTPGDLSAQAQSTYSENFNVSGVSTLQVLESVSAHGLLGPGPGFVYTPASALASLQASTVLTTIGPLRSGFLQVSLTGSGVNVGPEGHSGGLTIGLTGIAGDQFVANCFFASAGCGSTAISFQNIGKVAVTLGTNFTATASANPSIFADVNTYSSSGTIDVGYQFRFFEADGTTPVAVAAVPEPGAFSLAGVALAMLFGVRQIRRSRAE